MTYKSLTRYSAFHYYAGGQAVVRSYFPHWNTCRERYSNLFAKIPTILSAVFQVQMSSGRGSDYVSL